MSSSRAIPASIAPSDPPTVRGGVPRLAVIAVIAIAIVGIGLSGYLGFENLQGESGVCTGVAHGCATVQQSEYGKIAGVPVSVLGLFAYGAIGALGLLWFMNFRGQRALIAFAGFNVTLAALMFSAYLTYLEAFVIDAWCIYCITSASLVTALMVCWSVVLRGEVLAARRST
jgi:uncharacterized membrane protein